MLRCSIVKDSDNDDFVLDAIKVYQTSEAQYVSVVKYLQKNSQQICTYMLVYIAIDICTL